MHQFSLFPFFSSLSFFALAHKYAPVLLWTCYGYLSKGLDQITTNEFYHLRKDKPFQIQVKELIALVYRTCLSPLEKFSIFYEEDPSVIA